MTPRYYSWTLCPTCRKPRRRYETYERARHHNPKLNPRRDFLYAPEGPWGVPDGYRDWCEGH